MLKPTALDELGVESTTTALTDPSFYFYKSWCPMTETKKTESLHNMKDVTGVVYLNTDSDFRSVSIIQKTRKSHTSGRMALGPNRDPTKPSVSFPRHKEKKQKRKKLWIQL